MEQRREIVRQVASPSKKNLQGYRDFHNGFSLKNGEELFVSLKIYASEKENENYKLNLFIRQS